MIVNGVEVTHVDALLTEYAIGYRPEGFVADEIFPIIDVNKQSDIFATFGQEDTFREWDDNRAPGDMANEVRMRVGSDNFFCKNYALSAQIPDEMVANADTVFRNSLEESETGLVLDGLHIGWERRASALCFTAANIGSSAAVASSWADDVVGNSDPVGDINTAIDNVQDSTGFKPNRAVIGLTAWRSLRRHNDVIAKALKAQFSTALDGNGYPSAAQVAAIFDLDEIIVAGAFYNQAQENLPLSLAGIWSSHMLVYYNRNQPRWNVPTFGTTFNWRNGPMPRLAVERFAHNDERKAQKIQAGFYQDEKIVAQNLGFLVQAVNG